MTFVLSSIVLHFVVFRQSLLLNLKQISWLDWLILETQKSSCSQIPVLELCSSSPHTSVFHLPHFYFWYLLLNLTLVHSEVCFLLFLRFICFYFLCVFACAPHAYSVPSEAIKGCQIPWNWNRHLEAERRTCIF